MTDDQEQQYIDIEEWIKNNEEHLPDVKNFRIRLWGGEKFDEKRTLTDPIPTGRQILESFDLFPSDEFVLLYLPRDEKLEAVDLDETLDLRQRGPERFFAFKTDRLLNFVLNGTRFSWGSSEISGEMLRVIARIPDSDAVFLEKTDTADEEIADDQMVSLSEQGLERLSSRPKEWKLNVQGVLVTVSTPLILVKDALMQAGFDPNDNWITILKRKGEAKQQVALNDNIDLRHPGIEKLRLTPGQINNGEMQPPLKRDFEILDKDETYLERRGINWEAINDNGRRWVVLRNFILPDGYNHSIVDIAFDVPASYPRAEIDMFHCLPHLTLKSGGNIGETSGRSNIQGQFFQQWSRHLNGQTRWNPETDSVMTHIALIEAALSKEVGE